MEEYIIARVGKEDVQGLKRVETDCGLSPWTIDAYESELIRPEAVMLAAQTACMQLVGFLAGRIPLDENGAAEVYNIGIIPQYRREGIGSMLIDRFRTICSERRISVIWLEVRATNGAAIAFYRSHGFVNNGTRPSFYSDPIEDAQLMSLAVI